MSGIGEEFVNLKGFALCRAYFWGKVSAYHQGKVIDDFVRRYNNSESATLILIGLKNAIIIAFRNLRNE